MKKYLRKQCSLCSSSRKEEKIREFSSYKVCTICIGKNKTLKSYIVEYDKLINGEYLKKIKNNEGLDIENSIYTKNENADGKIVELIESISQKNKDKKKIEGEILTKVGSDLNKKNESAVKKTLNSMDIVGLNECHESLSDTVDIDDFKDKVITRKKITFLDLPNPLDIIKMLNESIIDQEEAVNSISVSLIQHLCRKKDPLIPKNNILLLGPTGTGKTEMARVMANFLNIPLVVVDSTSITAEGYVGASLTDTILNSLMSSTRNNKKLAENSIVFIDEIDKKATSKFKDSAVNTVSIQNELLKILEGSELRGQIQDGEKQKKVTLNTNNVLFICAGAFSNLEKIINRNSSKNTIGLNSKIEVNTEKDFSEIQTENLVEYGLTPEFLGRFSTITYTKKLSSESLYKILKFKKNSIIDQYERIFKQFNVDVVFTDDFLYSIIDEAQREEIGARGLYRIFSKKIKNILMNVYQYVNQEIHVFSNEKIIVKKKKEDSSSFL